ncbi:MAG: pyrroline-5-carboxylate reductase [Aquincola sp.]|nr:pyrroline-5-carboxylate reductase [Aquincola sp.]
MRALGLAFIGGGNMAGAIFGGLLRGGWPAETITVVEPSDEQRDRLAAASPGLRLLAAADASLAAADLVVWAVKPQSFVEAAAPCTPHVRRALQLSVMAGIRSDAIAKAAGTDRVVRAMPNTPALIGRGIAGLFARAGVTGSDREDVERVLAPTGNLLWFPAESDLDAVTALSGSGPAYAFYLIEAMVDAGTRMALAPDAARRLAQETLAGAAQLAMQSDDSPAALRERVTSKGGTTQAAIGVLEAAGVKDAFVRALLAARARAEELGR